MMEDLQRRIADLEEENARLRRALGGSDTRLENSEETTCDAKKAEHTWECSHDLTAQQVSRYSRHLMLPTFGSEAQSRLCRGSVLVVGAGGLGSAALLYLAGAGVGKVGIADNDTVAANNLHRQVIHNEASVGELKTASAKRACHNLNSSVAVELHSEGVTPENVCGIVDQYEVVIDASDNAPTRYLMSDACVVTGKSLVSGAAISTDGQLTVYNHGEDGPCYRCLFPNPPPQGACSRCSEAGVLGPVPGTIGVLQALEAIKIIAGVGDVLSKRMLIVDFLRSDFRTVKLRGKNAMCIACGEQRSLTRSNLAVYDYCAFTHQAFTESINANVENQLSIDERLTPLQLAHVLTSTAGRVPILDVRPRTEFEICHLKESLNCPVGELAKGMPEMAREYLAQSSARSGGNATGSGPVVVVCRKGNDSQIAVGALKKEGIEDVKDLIGGLEAWQEQLDPSFLRY